jgi:hypothetical protein
MLDGEVQRDTFSYTITNDSGLTDTATVSFSVAGITDPPVYFGETTVQFSFLPSGFGYEIAQGFLVDQDEDGAVSLDVTSVGSETLPAWLGYDGGARTLSVDVTEFNLAPEVGLNRFTLHGIENDGANSTLPLDLFVETDGSILFALVGRTDTQAAPARLEIGIDGGGPSGLVDLSGVGSINALVPGENILSDVGYIDLRNGEGETLDVDADDLLALLEGNEGPSAEHLIFEMDWFDDVEFDEDGYNVTFNEGTGNLELSASGGSPLATYADSEGIFATIFVDVSLPPE